MHLLTLWRPRVSIAKQSAKSGPSPLYCCPLNGYIARCCPYELNVTDLCSAQGTGSSFNQMPFLPPPMTHTGTSGAEPRFAGPCKSVALITEPRLLLNGWNWINSKMEWNWLHCCCQCMWLSSLRSCHSGHSDTAESRDACPSQCTGSTRRMAACLTTSTTHN